MNEHLRSDYRDKVRRASRREANRRHLQYEGKSSAIRTFKWGGKVRVSNDPNYDYQNEVGGFKSTAHYKNGHWSECKEPRGFRYSIVDRYLEANVGRHWDDIWSDICSRFDGRSDRGRAIRRMFGDRWKVEYHCYVSVDGNVRDNRSCYIVDGLYIHPRTGVLCNAKGESIHSRIRKEKKTFVSSEIGLHIGEEPFFIGHWRNNHRTWHYKYFLEEVGKVSKKPTKNRIDAWFVMWNEVVDAESKWKPVPFWYTQFYGEAALRDWGYEKRRVTYFDEVREEWGKWEVKEVTRERRRSCTKAEIAWIHNLIRERQDGVTNRQLKKNREGDVIRRRSRPLWMCDTSYEAMLRMDAREERRKGGLPCHKY